MAFTELDIFKVFDSVNRFAEVDMPTASVDGDLG